MQRSDHNGAANILDNFLSARPRLKIFQGRDGLFYFRLYDYSGDVLLTSQGVPDKEECRINLDTARASVLQEDNFKRQTTKNSTFTYLLQDRPAGRVLAVGAGYSTVRDCDDAIRSLKHTMGEAVLE